MSQTNPTDAEATVLAREFIFHGCRTSAWRIAFPDSEAELPNQHVAASRAFATPQVRARIQELQAISKEQSEEAFSMTVSELKNKLNDVMVLGALNGKLTAVVGAISEFNKMDGNHAATKTEITGELNTNVKVIRVRTKKVDKPDNDE